MFNCAIKRHIIAYPFLHTDRELFEYFELTHSSFVLREAHIAADSGDSIILFCSPRCAWFNYNNKYTELRCNAFHKLFREIGVLQQYCRTQRCSRCQKLLCVLDNQNLYAEPMYDFVVETFEIEYSELIRSNTVHH